MKIEQLVDVLRALGVSPEEAHAAAELLRESPTPKELAPRRRRHVEPRPAGDGNVSPLARERARRILGR